MRRNSWFTILIVGALAAAGCREEQREPAAASPPAAEVREPATATTVTSPAGPAPGDAKAPTVSADESRYLTEALQRGMGQIELAQMVSRRSESDAVDALAREITIAHNQVNAELTRIAFRASVTLPADAGPPELRETIARMEGLTARNLDAAYLAAVLQDYPGLVQLHDVAATTATDMELKKAAVGARAMFEANLRQARAAYAQVTGVVPPMPPAEQGSPPPASATSP